MSVTNLVIRERWEATKEMEGRVSNDSPMIKKREGKRGRAVSLGGREARDATHTSHCSKASVSLPSMPPSIRTGRYKVTQTTGTSLDGSAFIEKKKQRGETQKETKNLVWKAIDEKKFQRKGKGDFGKGDFR
jgi:hypothetical protein